MKTVFLRVLEAGDKEQALLVTARTPEIAREVRRFELDPASLASVPQSPFAYWVSGRLRGLFTRLPALASGKRSAVIGASTKDDGRFLRASWEVKPEAVGNVPFAKGGRFSPFYADIHLLLRWPNDGYEAKTFVSDYRAAHGWSPHWKAELHNPDFYFRPGLTWPRRTTSGLSLRVMPKGCIFGDKGPAAFMTDDESHELLALLAVGTSSAFAAVTDIQLAAADAAARSYEVGVIQRTPVPDLTPGDQAALAAVGRRAWSLKRSLDTRTETSHVFALPALLQVPGDSLAVCAAAWAERARLVEGELAAIQAEIDTRCFDLYGINETDRRAITDGFGTPADESATDAEPEPDDEADADGAEAALADAASLTAELVSWAAGMAFGRFDVRLATGERSVPPEPDPFDPLPVCSPGMLTDGDGLPLAEPPAGYPLAFPTGGVLVDDPGHPRDFTAAVRAVFDIVFGGDADARWREAAELVDPKGHDLRAWLSGSFFEHHLKRYSKSRRKAPILWQLATPSGSYSVWLYAHRLTPDTFFHVQNEYVAPKLAHEERKLAALVRDGGANPTAASRKAIDRQETFVEELRGLRDEVARVAPLWKPDLDDGVLLTMAPLWRLVPKHRAWQKELRSAWEALSSGKYDWAHLAMHLWPERVVPKGATDRSLAIAHGLEDVFWVEAAGGKWQPRRKPLRPVEELVRERTSPAVKAALSALLHAPTVSGKGRPGRKASGGNGGTV